MGQARARGSRDERIQLAEARALADRVCLERQRACAPAWLREHL